jgi:hypothetical protein
MALWVGLAAAMPLVAQTSSPAEDRSAPALTHDLTINAGDSRLVAAAKRAVIYRRAMNSKGPVWRIDDTMVRRVLVGQTAASRDGYGGNSSAETGGYSAQTISTGGGPNYGELRQVREGLQQKMERMASESLEVYGGDVSEDEANKNMNTLPNQINAVDHVLQQAPPQTLPTIPPSQ